MSNFQDNHHIEQQTPHESYNEHHVVEEDTIRPGLNALSTCAIAIVLPGAWQFAAATIVTGIYGGGACTQIWGSLISGLALSIFCSSLAEFASAFPSPAGCTHIAFQVAPPSWGPFVSYFTGSIHSWAVLFTPPAIVLAVCNLLFTCVCVMMPEYQPERWHIFLAFQGFNLAYFLSVRHGTVILSFLMETAIIIFIVGFVVTIAVAVGLSSHQPRPSTESIWLDFSNNSGFQSPILGALLGVTGPLYAYGPPHWLLNMADDIKNPSKNIPLGIVSQQVGGTITLFLFYIAIFYSVPEYDAILNSTYPSIVGSLYQAATRHVGVTLFLLLILFVSSALQTFGYISASIRLLYGFSRNGSFTNAHWWSKIDVKRNIPINVLYVSTFANFLLGFIYLVSEYGFQILLGSAQGLFVLGYLPMLICCVFTGRRYFYNNLARSYPDRKPYYSLRKPLGLACDIFSLFLELIILGIYCLPPAGPVTVQNFNWTPLFLVWVLLITMISWFFHGRKRYLHNTLDGLSISMTSAVHADAPVRRESVKDSTMFSSTGNNT